MIFDLTFSDWDNYVDGDANAFSLDWSSPAAMLGKPAYPYVDAIRQALNERITISQVGATDRTIAAATSSQLSENWIEYVLKTAIEYLRATDFYGANPTSYGAFDWIVPGSLSTLHDVQGGARVALSDSTLYPGYGLYWADSTLWTSRVTAMLDAAGIADSALRTWWLSNPGSPTAIEEKMIFPRADVVHLLKSLLSLLTLGVETRFISSAPEWNGPNTTPTANYWRFGKAGTYAGAVAIMNAQSWQATTYTVGVGWSTWPDAYLYGFHGDGPGHRGEQASSTNLLDINPGAAFLRWRTDYDIPLYGTAKRDGEIGLLCTMYNPAVGLGSPYLFPSDYAALVNTPAGIDPDPGGIFVQYEALSGQAGATLSRSVGNFGNVSLPSYPGPTAQTYQGYFHRYLGILQDFDVADGFTFR